MGVDAANLIYKAAATKDLNYIAAFNTNAGRAELGAGTITVWQLNGTDRTLLGDLPRKQHAIAFGNRGFLVTGGDAGDVAVWDPAKLKELERLQGLTGKVLSVAASDDNKRIAAAGTKGVGVWTVSEQEGGQPTYRQFTQYGATYVAFSPDNKWLFVVYQDSPPELYNVETGKLLCRFDIGDSSRPATVAFHPDGGELTIGFDGGIQTYKLP